MTSLWPVVFSNGAAISLSGAAIPPPAMIWSSAAMADSETQDVQPARRTTLHTFMSHPFSRPFGYKAMAVASLANCSGGFDVAGSDDFAPLLGLFGDEFSE